MKQPQTDTPEQRGIVGYLPGAYDLVHAGHCLALQEAKRNCDYLIVGLGINPQDGNPQKNIPVMTLEERYIMLKANKYVDAIVVYDSEHESKEIDSWLPYDVRFMGEDHKGKEHPHITKPIFYLSRQHNFSSTNLRKRIYDAESNVRK